MNKDSIAEPALGDWTSEVLIIEDNQNSLKLLSELMSGRGYKVRLALNGEVALSSVQQKTPDIILLDVRMPGIDGFEVCRRLKSNPDTAAVPIIFLSALDDVDAKVQGLKMGAVDYIAKPYAAEEVLQRVSFHLELRHLQTKLEDMCILRTQQLEKEVLTRKNAEEELRQSQQQLRQLAGHLQEVREEERKRISREIHDELGQSLTLAKLNLSQLKLNLTAPKETLEEGIDRVTEAVEQASDLARSISENLRPGMIDLVGLGPAIEEYVMQVKEKGGVNCNLYMSNGGEFDTDDQVSIAAFRVVQESLTNVMRYAKASQVDIKVMDIGAELLVIVSDNGVGIDPEKLKEKGHFGLLGMKERVSLLNGHLLIESSPGNGTRIEAGLPLAKARHKV